ncbi:MAG: hypothetical protein EAX87_03715 [Candidatus Thorarchaeota archaeon]|nr:hypothetical protein [Candidatus Thorarchaeota archaeon]
MTDTVAKRRRIPIFLVKMLVVLIFPLQMVIAPPNFRWTSLLLVVQNNQFPFFTSIPALLIGLIVMLPCIFFERLLYSSSISRTVRKQVAAACASSCGIALAIQLTRLVNPPPNILLLAFNSAPYAQAATLYAPILGISFFVVLPLILRQSALSFVSVDHRQLGYQVINSLLQKRFKREKVLSTLFWFCLLFCPFLLGLDTTWWTFRLSSLSVFYIMNYSAYSLLAQVIPAMGSLTLISTDFISLPITALLSSVRFVFVRDLFRYQQHIINRSRVASTGILGEILPSAIITLLALSRDISPAAILLIFPTPILLFAGIALIKFSRTTPLKDELWPDYESKMWYDQRQKPHATESGDESVKVPLTYLLMSKVRKLRHKKT